MYLKNFFKRTKKFLIENPFGVIILSILSGLTANAIPALFPILNKTTNVKIWILVTLAISGFLVALFPSSLIISSQARKYNNDKKKYEENKQELQKSQKAYQVKNRITLMDEELLNYISKLAKGNSTGDQLDVLTTRILSVIANEIELFAFNYCGLSIFCPDPKNTEYLISWKCYYAESQEFFKFYIGNNRNEDQGVAGKTFKDQKIRVVHIDQKEDGSIKSDCDLYVIFPGQKPRYQSFICVPIIGDKGNSLGVLSIDSTQKDAFDSEETKELITSLSKRFAAILTVTTDMSILPSQNNNIQIK